MENVKKKENNKYNKYYAIQRGAILKAKKTRRTIYFIDNQYFVFLVLLVFKIS